MAYELEEAKKLVVAAGKKLVESGLIARRQRQSAFRQSWHR